MGCAMPDTDASHSVYMCLCEAMISSLGPVNAIPVWRPVLMCD